MAKMFLVSSGRDVVAMKLFFSSTLTDNSGFLAVGIVIEITRQKANQHQPLSKYLS